VVGLDGRCPIFGLPGAFPVPTEEETSTARKGSQPALSFRSRAKNLLPPPSVGADRPSASEVCRPAGRRGWRHKGVTPRSRGPRRHRQFGCVDLPGRRVPSHVVARAVNGRARASNQHPDAVSGCARLALGYVRPWRMAHHRRAKTPSGSHEARTASSRLRVGSSQGWWRELSQMLLTLDTGNVQGA
jgi:hypothetical protein